MMMMMVMTTMTSLRETAALWVSATPPGNRGEGRRQAGQWGQSSRGGFVFAAYKHLMWIAA